MGGSATSQRSVLRGEAHGGHAGYDLNSWQGLTELLRVGKDSLKAPGAYSEFRNLVLQYAQQRGDVELRKQIDAITATFTSSSVLETEKKTEKTAPPPPPPPAPVKRVEVSSNVSTGVTVTASVPKAEIKKEEQPIQVAQSSETISARKDRVPLVTLRRVTPQFTPVPRASAPVPQTPEVKNETVVVTPPVESVVLEVKHATVDEHTSPVPVPEPKVVAAQEVHVEGSKKQRTLEEHKARISEIKKLVHERVGNPVTLIHAENNHGREYMNALLGALKATTAGSQSEIEAAMDRLESAFVALTGSKNEASSNTQSDVENEKKVPEPTPLPPPPPVKEAVKEEKVVLYVSDKPKDKIITPPVTEERTQSVPVITHEKTQQENDDVPSHVVGVVTQKSEAPDPAIEPPLPLHEDVEHSVSGVQESAVVPESQPAPIEQNPSLVQVESEKQQEQESVILSQVPTVPIAPIKKEPPLATENQGDLNTEQITNALRTLLHEWSLFSSSGFLGIGPSGFEHPLYIQLAPISVVEILAGRWEGANPKQIRIIKEYVDAWRHEQGVTYLADESFEHYLRRVVQRIQKRQQGAL